MFTKNIVFQTSLFIRVQIVFIFCKKSANWTPFWGFSDSMMAKHSTKVSLIILHSACEKWVLSLFIQVESTDSWTWRVQQFLSISKLGSLTGSSSRACGDPSMLIWKWRGEEIKTEEVKINIWRKYFLYWNLLPLLIFLWMWF